MLSTGCILYKWRRSGILNLLPTNVIYNVYSINWFNRIHTYVVRSIAFTDNYNLLHVSALSAPSLGNADCAYIKRSSTQHMFSRSVSKDFENQNEQIYSVFTYKTAILYKIFAFKHLIPLREWIFFFFELGRTLLKWTNCAPKNYILLQFYIEILNTLLLNIIFQVNFSKAHVVRFIVMLCLWQTRNVLPNVDTCTCLYLVLSFISVMVAQNQPKRVEKYNSICWLYRKSTSTYTFWTNWYMSNARKNTKNINVNIECVLFSNLFLKLK